MIKKLSHETSSAAQTTALGKRLAPQLKGQNLLLFGDLGLGKTTFVRGLATGFGITAAVKSPTFILERTFTLPDNQQFVHLDFYRLNNIELEMTLHLQELFADQESTVAIEWAERLDPRTLPHERTEITFQELGPDQRRVELCWF